MSADEQTRERLERLLRHKYDGIEQMPGGGMSLVFRATHRELNVVRVIKVLRPGFATLSSATRELFLAEARTLGRLNHPNIVPVVDFESDPDDPELLAFTMPFIEGEDLQRRIGRFSAEPLPLEETLSIVRQVLQALMHAHGAGIIHRDIKPANILIQESDRRVFLSDFGIAKYLRDADRAATSRWFGTTAYMSPEQLLGTARDGRTDLYGVGCVLYECLTGKMLFGADRSDEEIRALKLEGEAPIDPANAGSVPPHLVELVRDLVAHEAEQRPESAGAVLERLNGGARTKRDRCDRTGGRSGGRWGRSRAVAAGAGLIAVTALAFALSRYRQESSGSAGLPAARSAVDSFGEVIISPDAASEGVSEREPVPGASDVRRAAGQPPHQGESGPSHADASRAAAVPVPAGAQSAIETRSAQVESGARSAPEGMMTIRVGVQGGGAPRARVEINGQPVGVVPVVRQVAVREGDTLTVRIEDREVGFEEQTRQVVAKAGGEATILFRVLR